jgi:hypothetical protein
MSTEPSHAEKAYEFLAAMARDSRITLIAIAPESGALAARTFAAMDHTAILAWLTERNGHQNLYFQVNPLRPEIAHKKATKAEIAHAVTLHVDIDELDGLERLRTFVLPPSAVACSGNGYHAYWLLTEPCTDLTRAERLNATLIKKLGGDIGTGNIDRLLRIPFTQNLPDARKRARGKVVVESYLVDDLTDFTRRYSIDELEGVLPAADPDEPPPGASPPAVVTRPVEYDAEGLPVAISEETRAIILTGGHIGSEGYKSRSEAVFRVLCDLARIGLEPATMVPIITNPGFGISASILDKPRPEAYALRQAEKASSAVNSDWQRTKGGQIIPNLRNTQLAVMRLGAQVSHDRFRQRFTVFGHPIQEFAGDFTGNGAARIRHLILHTFDFDPSSQHTNDALQTLALENSHNSMEEYFDGLLWDGTPRLGTLLIDYFGAADTPFNRSVGMKPFIAAVRRVRMPGTKFDSVLVLEGPQGGGKSTALRILAGSENFSDQGILCADEKTQMEALEGMLIVELSELEGMFRSDIAKVKAFLSRAIDRARPAYGRNREHRPRTCVFIGTTNDEHYLRDPTGNRRFWPVAVTRIDLKALEHDRDQLWAEAAHLEAKGARIELEAELYAPAATLQMDRLEVDPWSDLLADLKGVVADGVERIFSANIPKFLEVPTDRLNTAMSKRIAQIMRRHGWEGPKAIRINGQQGKGYARPAIASSPAKEDVM